MSKTIQYKKYRATIKFDPQDNIIIGEVIGIRDSLNFHGKDETEAVKMFHQCIDNYILVCHNLNTKPNHPSKQSVRIQAIPGHVYEDTKGVRIIYLGFGEYKREDPSLGSIGGWRSGPNKHLYMKFNDVNDKISRRDLSPDLRQYKKNNQDNGTDFFKTIFFSEKPRKLVRDLGKVFDENYFKHLVIEDYTYTSVYNTIIYWTIDTY